MRRLLAGLALAAALGVAGSLALRLLAPAPSDEEAIRGLFRDAAAAMAEKRVGDAMEPVAEGFEGQGLDRRGLHRLLLGHSLRGSWLSVHVAADRVRVEGDAADAVLLAVAARGGAGAALVDLLPANATALRVACRLARAGGEWRVVAAEWHEIGLEEARGAQGAEWLELGPR